MLKIHEDIFDKRWLDELSATLIEEKWSCNNIANRSTWPYGNKGSHMIMGNLYFQRANDNEIYYNDNKRLTKMLIHAFEGIENKTQKMKLHEITANLQFCGMDGSMHTDGTAEHFVYIVMLSNDVIDKNIGGSFYHQPTDTSVPFKYGRVIEQNGLDLHKAYAFNKPNIARMSVKWVGTKWI
jgi:hypothetical protein